MDQPTLPRILDAGDSCLVAEFGTTVDRALNAKVQALKKALAKCGIRGIVELVPTYRSLAVYYDPCVVGRKDLAARIEAVCLDLGDEGSGAGRVVAIPVCYGGTFGPDLENVCAHTGLSKEEVIARHTGRETYCFMLGFTPGFAYLGGMDESLATPRLENPRTLIPAGSVGIAGKQTGIYPIDSPGGWQLIGRTPLAVFDPLRTPPTLVEAGDWVRFQAITEAEYEEIQSAARAGKYTVRAAFRKEAE
ncbi:MAG: 5-oxoprolinase subunit PxpB [Synergistaceae bacterium]|nr:5-oxoprolinase subunit PxpB [Synergistaceae bacterium]